MSLKSYLVHQAGQVVGVLKRLLRAGKTPSHPGDSQSITAQEIGMTVMDAASFLAPVPSGPCSRGLRFGASA